MIYTNVQQEVDDGSETEEEEMHVPEKTKASGQKDNNNSATNKGDTILCAQSDDDEYDSDQDVNSDRDSDSDEEDDMYPETASETSECDQAPTRFPDFLRKRMNRSPTSVIFGSILQEEEFLPE